MAEVPRSLTAPDLVRDLFLILARQPTKATDLLAAVINKFADVRIVVDRPAVGMEVIWVDDATVAGFHGIMGSSHFPPLTAWSRALWVAGGLCAERQSAVWFIEEDVATDYGSLRALKNHTSSGYPDLATLDVRSRQQTPNWPWWKKGEGLFAPENQFRSFNPLCRMSPDMLKAVLRWRRNRGHLAFHELLFPTLAKLGGLSVMDWREEREVAGLFRDFRWRPAVTRCGPGIRHPVKDPLASKATD